MSLANRKEDRYYGRLCKATCSLSCTISTGRRRRLFQGVARRYLLHDYRINAKTKQNEADSLRQIMTKEAEKVG